MGFQVNLIWFIDILVTFIYLFIYLRLSHALKKKKKILQMNIKSTLLWGVELI